MECNRFELEFLMADVVHVRAQKVYKERRTPRESDFRSLFRFDEINVQWLADYFIGENLETRGGALSPVQKMKVVLRYMADPGFQSGIGEELGCTQPTVSRIVATTLDLIVDKANEWIKFPSTENEVMEAKVKWAASKNFPTAIGAIDCTHVEIEKPRQFGDEYVNRKNYASINVQAICDQNYVFMNIDARWPGSVHDSRIWKNSSAHEMMQRTTNTVLLGDSGYGIMPYLMKPFSIVENAEQAAFNRLLKKERVIIEHAFGQLKRRFPILKYVCRVKLENIPKVIVACAVLHNIAKYLGDEDFEDADEIEDDELLQEVPEMTDAATRAQGHARRTQLAQLIYNNNIGERISQSNFLPIIILMFVHRSLKAYDGHRKEGKEIILVLFSKKLQPLIIRSLFSKINLTKRRYFVLSLQQFKCILILINKCWRWGW